MQEEPQSVQSPNLVFDEEIVAIKDLCWGKSCAACGTHTELKKELMGRSKRAYLVAILAGVLTLVALGVLLAMFSTPESYVNFIMGFFLLLGMKAILALFSYLVYLRGSLWIRRRLAYKFGAVGSYCGLILVVPAWLIQAFVVLPTSAEISTMSSTMLLTHLSLNCFLLPIVIGDTLSRVYLRVPFCENCIRNAKNIVQVLDYWPLKKEVRVRGPIASQKNHSPQST